MSDETFVQKDPRKLENVGIGELVPINHWDDVLPPGDTFEIVIWYPEGDSRPALQRLCWMRDRGYITITADADEQGRRYYEIGQGMPRPWAPQG